MIESILRFREPAAWLVLAVTVASIALSLARFGVVIASGASGIVAASQDVANSAMNLSLLVLIVALVCACLFVTPATPRASAVAKTAAVVVTLGTVLTLVAMLVGLTASAGTLGVILEMLGGLLDVILKTAASIVLWLIVRAVGAGRLELAEAVAPAGAVETVPPTQQPADAPTWRPSEASGSVWRTASEAAEGAPAAGHGVGGGGWHRVDRTPPALDHQPLSGDILDLSDASGDQTGLTNRE